MLRGDKASHPSLHDSADTGSGRRRSPSRDDSFYLADARSLKRVSAAAIVIGTGYAILNDAELMMKKENGAAGVLEAHARDAGRRRRGASEPIACQSMSMYERSFCSTTRIIAMDVHCLHA